jgi:hypothetical protein
VTAYMAIDPGSEESAYVVTDQNLRTLESGKICNDLLRRLLRGIMWANKVEIVAIEMVTSYGMPVGAEVFQTCVWTGRFIEQLHERVPVLAIPRRDVKTHICQSARAKDSNIRQALVDRFAAGMPNGGKGTTKHPGWFHGFRADIWQAYALAVYVVDNESKLIPAIPADV